MFVVISINTRSDFTPAVIVEQDTTWSVITHINTEGPMPLEPIYQPTFARRIYVDRSMTSVVVLASIDTDSQS